MEILILSLVAPPLGLASFWFSLRHPWGWIFGIAQSVVYATLGVASGAIGLLIFSPLYILVFSRNFYLAEKDHKKKLAKKAKKTAKKQAKIARRVAEENATLCIIGGSNAKG